MNKDKYCIYARVGTQQQEETRVSINSQVERLETFAKENGYQITDTFTDIGSANDGERAGFESMIKKVKKGEVGGILCTDISRLIRSPKLTVLLDELVRTKGIGLVTPDFVYGESAAKDFAWNISTILAKTYQKQLSDNVKRGLAIRKARLQGLV